MRPSRMRSAGLLAAVVAAALLAAAPAHADTVVDWNVHATNALVTTATPPASQPPPVQTIHLAMVHGAVYDAVNAIDRGHEPYLVKPRARRWYSKDAAAATAAYHVLVSVVPAQQPALQEHLRASLASIPNGRAESGGIAVGEAAAAAMIAARTNDGRFGAFRFPVGTKPGQWRPVLPMFVNDPNAWVAHVKPFMIPAQSHFGSDGPSDLGSRRYAREFDEVKRLGSATSGERTADQTDAARFWAEGPMIITRAVRELSARFCLKTADNARLFAMLYLTGADSLISVWYDKARWLFWRPITAIQEADDDGNPATEADPGWLPLINNPPYPEHPSGLVGVVTAMGETLEDFFGTDRIAFSATSMNPPMSTRSFGSFSQAIEEVVDARVWSGIHFRNAEEDSARIGKQVAHWRDHYYFGKKHH
jgi:hypothetical protein